MFIPKSPHTKIALETLYHYFAKEPSTNLIFEDIPSELFQFKRACFVSLHNQKDDSLRGCIGTLEPQQENLVAEIQHNAISAAMNDHRFSPLNFDELLTVDISVDVLSVPEIIYSKDELDPGIYGLILSDKSGRRGLLLPSLPGIETVEKQIEIVKRKAGLKNVNLEELMIKRFTSTRYH